MDNTIKVGILVSDNGSSEKTTKNVKNLKDVLDQTQVSASNASKTLKGMAAPGSATSGRLRAATEASVSQSYGQARGNLGTGAEARDFAKQSQGLGGLVRLYATYAANIFAVTAAFTALSDAMNTTNMVKGLDQLGAASGVALGSLAKQFTAASGGAISLREAMEATTKATASGLSSEQFLKLGEVAKKASQALGVNMSDAVSRLTRGITKLEPELLDELGIFTKVGKATEDYARSIGKSVTALTDFERRQAFTNAVLAEGTQKFSEINIPTNPYDQLLASLKNIAQQILEVVNKALVPFVSLLSQSPTALLGIVGLLGVTLLKQALPALGEYKKGLQEAAAESENVFKARATAAKKALDIAKAAKAAEIKQELDNIAVRKTAIVDEQQRNLKAIAAGQGISKRAQQILRPDRPIQDITEKQLKYLEDQGKKTTILAGTYRALAASIREAQTAEQAYQATATKLEKEKLAAPGRYSPAGRAASQEESSRKAKAGFAIVSQASETASTLGFFASMKETITSIKTEKLGLIRGGITGIASAASAATTAIGGILSVASKFLGYIGIAVTIFQIFSSLVSKNSAEVAAFNDSLDTLSKTTTTATDVQKKYGDTLSVEGIIAKANALDTLSTSIKASTASFTAAQASANWFDKFIDTLLIPLGKDVETKFAKQLSVSVTAALSNVSDPAAKKAAEDSIKSLLNIENLDLDSLEKGIKKSTDVAKKGVSDVAEGLKKIQLAAAKPLIEVKEGFVGLDKSFTDLSNSFANKDLGTTFAVGLIKQTELLTAAFDNPTTRATQLAEILKDINQIKMFAPETQQSILQAARDTANLTAEIEAAKKQIVEANKQIAATEPQVRAGANPAFLPQRVEAQATLQQATKTLQVSTQKLNDINTNLTKGLSAAATQAFQLIEAPLVRAYAQAAIESQKTLLGFLPKTAGSALLGAKLEVQAIEIRKQEISSLYKLTVAVDKDRLSRERQSLVTEKTELAKRGASTEDIQKQIDLVDQQLTALKSPRELSGQKVSGEAAAIITRGVGFESQLATLISQQKEVNIRGIVDSISAGFAQTKELEQRNLEKLKQENAKFFDSDVFRALAPAEQTREKATRTAAETSKADELQQLVPLEKRATAILVERLSTSKALTNLAKEALTAAEQERDALTETQQNAAKLLATEAVRVSNFQEITAGYEQQKLIAETAVAETNRQNQLEQESLGVEQQKLEVANSLGKLTKDEYEAQKRINDLKQVDLETSSKLFNLLNDYTAKQRELALQMANPANAGNLTALAAQAAENARIYAGDSAAAVKSADLKKESINLTKDMTERTATYAQAFESTVKGMSDALVDFALTGKQSFGEMIESMIIGLIKYESQMMITKAFSSAGGFSGLATSFVSSFFGGGGLGGGAPDLAGSMAFNGMMPAAKGAAFDTGVQAFAKGGAFTNTVVTKPTTFAFAKGAGLMGESGPEAIMPLKRGANGSLGVEGGSSTKVDVVVNNYGSEKATTRETTDSRGNRRVEVQIGEMVAGEMQRPHSPMQGTMRSTYGIAPVLTRR